MVKKLWRNICEYPWVSLVIGCGILIILVVFTVYGLSLGSLSHEHAAWSSFGSMLAGAFTLFGTTATVGTLLFLNAQFKEQQKVTSKQIEALTFDQYINHRKLFFEQLRFVEDVLEGKVRFKNHDHLYHKLFPDNSPYYCTFKVELVSDGLLQVGGLSDMYASVQRLEIALNKNQWLPMEADDLIKQLLLMRNKFNFTHVEEPSDGDVFLDDYNLGINIYSIEEYIGRQLAVVNSFLFYTGNKQFGSMFHLAASDELRQALMRNFNGRTVQKHSLAPIKTIRFIDDLERVFHWVSQAKSNGGEILFPNIYQKLSVVFSSRVEVNKLKDKAVYIAMIKEFLSEVNAVNRGARDGTIESKLSRELKEELMGFYK